MICMSRRKQRISPSLALPRSSPLKRTVHDVGSMRRRTSRPSVLLPEPDSPTRPSVSPDWMSSETSTTARTSPFAPPPKIDSPSGKTLVRLRISTSATTLSSRDQGHRRQRRDHSRGFPAIEPFLQDCARQQDCNHWIQRSEHYRRVQSSGLGGANEHHRAADVEASGQGPDHRAFRVKRTKLLPRDRNDRSHKQRRSS